MLQIVCPNNNIPERTYAINVLFNELLGCSVTDNNILFEDSAKDYFIVLDGKTILIEDHFFQKYPKSLSYLDKKNIPDTLVYFHGFGLEIPIIYGVDRFKEEADRITIGLDVFASTFFMLTRWEESLLGREEKGDCDENQLFAVKNGIYQRPIVHEYEELLRLLLSGNGMVFRERKYSVVMSHDVDGFLTPTFGDIIKSVIRQLRFGPPKNKVLNLTWKEKMKYRKAFPNTFSQFDFYTELCKKYDVPEWFYFKVCDTGEDEYTYKHNASQTKAVVKRLKEMGNSKIVLGFHPSQSTFENERQWDKEQDRINALIGHVPAIGRNHHLLYNYNMLRMWENMAKGTSTGDLEISNCVFHKLIGFRSGLAILYRIFDIYQRKTMKLIEHPCQIMDMFIRYHRRDTDEAIWENIKSVIKATRQYNGELILTWHIFIRNSKWIRNNIRWCEEVAQFANNNYFSCKESQTRHV